MGKLNRSSMPQNKSASVAGGTAAAAQRALDKAKEREARGFTGFTRPTRKKELKAKRDQGVQMGAARRGGESKLGQGTRGGQY